MLSNVHALSATTTAVVYFVAFVAFVLATVAAFPPRPAPPARRTFQSFLWVFIAAGLALCVFVLFWNAWALT